MQELISYIQETFRGNSILFVGSGFSLTAKNTTDANIISSRQLTEKLYNAISLESDNELSNAVDEYLLHNTESELISLLKSEFSVKEISQEQKDVISIPWKRVYTTNYDDVVEMAYRANNKLASPITLSNKMNEIKDKFNCCIHLNGFIGSLTPDKIKSEFKLSDTSYLAEDFLKSEWITLLRNDIHDCDVVVFIGFSLRYDLDIRRIIYNSNINSSKIIFILAEDEPEINLRSFRKCGVPFTIGLKEFSRIIVLEKSEYIPAQIKEYRYLSFKKHEIKSGIEKIHDKDVFDMFFEGNISDQFIYQSLLDSSNQKYFIKRDKIDSVFNSIEAGSKRILVHSDLGNGKTIFVQGLSLLLASRGYSVFSYSRSSENVNNEIEHIASLHKPVIILESYNNYYNILKSILQYANNDLTIIITERTFINDTVYSRLYDDGFIDYINVDLNYLSDAEIIHFIDLLDTYGFWGDFASYSRDKKLSLIKGNNCQKQLRLILLTILNSSDIKKRFSKILNIIIEKKSFYNAVLLILASNVFDFRFDLDQLVYILDDEILLNSTFVNNTSLKEMIDFSRDEIKVRSSILSEAILTNLDDQQILIDCLIKVVKKVSTRMHDSKMKQTHRAIISFSRLQRILNKKSPTYKQTLISFFEEVKNLISTRNDPYFWLQYAIASLSFKDYELADTYFRNAYSYADRKGGFDTFQIDNHYARHILESEIYIGEVSTCMQQFAKAHEILTRKSNNDGRHYPIRVAKNYELFYQRFFKELIPSDKNIFLKSCQEILFKIEDYKKINDRIFQKDVLDCEQSLTKIVLQEAAFQIRR